LEANHEFAKRFASSRRQAVEIRRPKDNALDVFHVLILRANFTDEAYQSNEEIFTDTNPLELSLSEVEMLHDEKSESAGQGWNRKTMRSLRAPTARNMTARGKREARRPWSVTQNAIEA